MNVDGQPVFNFENTKQSHQWMTHRDHVLHQGIHLLWPTHTLCAAQHFPTNKGIPKLTCPLCALASFWETEVSQRHPSTTSTSESPLCLCARLRASRPTLSSAMPSQSVLSNGRPLRVGGC
ncbi:hypothetical protein QOT17_014029 [Balamuthia mandrillaris]